MTTTSRNFTAGFQGRPFGERGNILIYVLMTMVIFAVIGVTMVSLFSTSVSSSATANETRRAFYMAESGAPVRHKRDADDSAPIKTKIDRLNNTINYKIPPSGEFEIAVFSAYFFSPWILELIKGILRPTRQYP